MSCTKNCRKALLAGAALFPALLVMLLPFAVDPARGNAVFRWKDDQGILHFTDDPTTIPEKYRGKSEQEMRREASPVIEQAVEEVPANDAPANDAPAEEETAPAEEKGSPAFQEALEATRSDVDNLGHDKQYWQDRRQYWERRLASSEALYAETRREFNLTNQRFDKREYSRLKALRDRMRALEGDIAQAKAMLDGGLAQEARRAGAQPGWVR
jgi:hypothetical protein